MEKEAVDGKVSIVPLKQHIMYVSCNMKEKTQHPCAICDEPMVVPLGCEEKVSEHHRYGS